MSLTWVNSYGGPLVLVPKGLVSSWRGVTGSSTGSRKNDYERACEVMDWAGIVPVFAASALVLANERTPTTWWPNARGGFLVCWHCAEDEESVVSHLRNGMPPIFEATGLTIQIPPEGALLFDSAEPGSDIRGDRLEIKPVPGVVKVETLMWEPDDLTSLLLYRLEPQ
ncbi:MAG: immunity 21 family protein [Planctomycetes bacterium]|nr:immunity 21 family protein [Planctomycetota bacterium]